MKLSIPESCHEDWGKMSKEEKGRFCGVCSKSVVDFTSMNKKEIKHYFISKKEEKTCGRFFSNQLTEPLPKVVDLYSKGLKRFAVALYFVFGLTLFSCEVNNREHIVGELEAIPEVFIDTPQTNIDSISTTIQSTLIGDTIDIIEIETIGEIEAIDEPEPEVLMGALKRNDKDIEREMRIGQAIIEEDEPVKKLGKVKVEHLNEKECSKNN